jgi:hypothetical protein
MKYFFRKVLRSKMPRLGAVGVSGPDELLPLQCSKVFAVNPFPTFKIHLIGSEVDSSPRQNPFLHYPGSPVKFNVFYVVVEIINVGADIESPTRDALNVDILVANIPLKKPRI